MSASTVKKAATKKTTAKKSVAKKPASVTHDPRVDAYIAKSALFARPILEYFREVVHVAVPEMTETIKWGFPQFEKGGIVCSMAAFKEHAAINFWNWKELLGSDARRDAMGAFGRVTSVKQLPPRKELIALVKQAAALRDAGVKRAAPARPRTPRELTVPDDLAAALKKNRKAAATFDAFPPSHRREYVDWITEAKREETRARRVEQTIEWLAEGKPRNWKYM